MLTDAELESIRAAIEELLPDICDILSVTHTSDGQGGWTEAWGTATASAPCRLDTARPGTEAVFGASVQPFQGYVLTLAHDETIVTGNRVACNGQTFNVVSVDLAKSWDGSRRAYLERI
jgi:xanthine dehydrogenase molybdopterin-binding subunit B